MKTRYEIVIKEFAEETVLNQSEWLEGAGDSDKPVNAGNYGYTPQLEQKKIVERKIYTQNVDYLDLSGVIAAVNEPPKQQIVGELREVEAKPLI